MVIVIIFDLLVTITLFICWCVQLAFISLRYPLGGGDLFTCSHTPTPTPTPNIFQVARTVRVEAVREDDLT